MSPCRTLCLLAASYIPRSSCVWLAFNLLENYKVKSKVTPTQNSVCILSFIFLPEPSVAKVLGLCEGNTNSENATVIAAVASLTQLEKRASEICGGVTLVVLIEEVTQVLPFFECYGPSVHKFRFTKQPQQRQQDEMTKDGFLSKPNQKYKNRNK